MLVIKHTVENRAKEVLRQGTMIGGETREECVTLIEEQSEAYDKHGYDDEFDRWWGRNIESPDEFHYWLIAGLDPES